MRNSEFQNGVILEVDEDNESITDASKSPMMRNQTFTKDKGKFFRSDVSNNEERKKSSMVQDRNTDFTQGLKSTNHEQMLKNREDSSSSEELDVPENKFAINAGGSF